MLRQDVVEPACSPHNAHLLLIPKRQSDWRVVVDFRKLNASTIPDRYLMPRLSDLHSLGDSNVVFSTLDLHPGFFQVEIEESSRSYTAFITPSGQFMSRCITQSQHNSPLTFQRLMNSLLSDLISKGVFCLLDYVTIASENLQEHFHTLSLVLSLFQAAGLKIKLSKCSFLKQQVKFFGHKVDKDGIHTLSDKVNAVQNFRSC